MKYLNSLEFTPDGQAIVIMAYLDAAGRLRESRLKLSAAASQRIRLWLNLEIQNQSITQRVKMN